jgi:hypothetical protein
MCIMSTCFPVSCMQKSAISRSWPLVTRWPAAWRRLFFPAGQVVADKRTKSQPAHQEQVNEQLREETASHFLLPPFHHDHQHSSANEVASLDAASNIEFGTTTLLPTSVPVRYHPSKLRAMAASCQRSLGRMASTIQLIFVCCHVSGWTRSLFFWNDQGCAFFADRFTL